MLKSGEVYYSSKVISNSDPINTFENMLNLKKMNP